MALLFAMIGFVEICLYLLSTGGRRLARGGFGYEQEKRADDAKRRLVWTG